MSSDRREFLQRLTIGSVAFGALPASLGAAEPDAVSVPFNEFAAIDQQPAAPTFDVAWTQKLTGKYKTVFDVPAINGGSGVWRAGMWKNHYRDVLKAEPADMSSVIVIRHEAIPLIMNHEFWDAYDVAKESKVRHPMTDKKTRRNPVLMTAEDDKLPASFVGYTLPKQMERGAIVLGCNLAFAGMVAMVAKKDKLKNPEARAKALSMIVPGVILQPNGIFGVTLAQHNGCAFVAAS
ncbi:MAG: hypothetical protein IPP90_14910 [Gemmatimonadaceae bacterium]|nr:hypothetical protein [Gemmatimonadaceae bacterium]